MPLIAALIYWIIVALWLSVRGTLLIFYIRNPRIFGTTRLLLAVNVIAGCVVLGLLLLRWLPSAVAEHQLLEIGADRARSLASMMEDFVANVSHELRTPLTSIAGSLGLLAAGAAGQLPQRAARLISIAHTNAQRLMRLINDILDIGKMEAGSTIF